MKVAIIEFIDEAKQLSVFCQKRGVKPSDLTVIALVPSVRVYLKKQGFNVLSSLDYFDNEANRRSSLKLSELMKCLEENFTFKDEFGISKSYNYTLVFYSQFYLAYLIWLSEIIQQVSIKHNNIDEIWAFSTDPTISKSPYITEEERYVGWFCSEFAKKKDIKFVDIGTTVDKRLKENVRKRNWLDNISSSLYIAALKNLKRDKNVFITTSMGHRMNRVVGDLQQAIPQSKWVLFYDGSSSSTIKRRFSPLGDFLMSLGWYIMSLLGRRAGEEKFGAGIDLSLNIPMMAQKDEGSDKEFNNKVLQAQDTLSNIDYSKFSHQDFSFESFFKDKLKISLLPTVIRTYYRTAKIAEVLDNIKVRGAISPHSLNMVSTFGELAKQKDIPAVLISHGSHPPPANDILKDEFSRHGRGLINTEYPFVSVQSVLTQKYLDYFSVKSERIYTGPLLWGNIDKDKARDTLSILGVPKNKRVILHAGTQKPRISTRFYLYETADEYVSALTDLIEAVDKLKDTVLIVKFRPTDNLSLEDLKQLLPESKNLFISVDEPFLDVLLQSDLLVSFSSTTMEEALENKKPVLQYGGRGRFAFLPGVNINSNEGIERAPVYFVENKQYLVNSLEGILNTFKDNPLREEELTDYVIPKNKRKSLIDFFTSYPKEKDLTGERKIYAKAQ